MRTMALDVGEKTIGVAVTDEMGWTAQGLTTIRRKTLDVDLESLVDLVKEYQVGTLVVGLPLRADGEVGTQAKKVEKFTDQIKKHLESIGREMTIEMWDESMTTADAHEIMSQAGVTTKKRKKVVDKLAAVLILESYMRGIDHY